MTIKTNYDRFDEGWEVVRPGPIPPTNMVDLRGFDSSIILILRGGIPKPIGIS